MRGLTLDSHRGQQLLPYPMSAAEEANNNLTTQAGLAMGKGDKMDQTHSNGQATPGLRAGHHQKTIA